MTDRPLIFIHYGDSGYLPYTLESARLFNPDKRIVLLGDQANAHYAAMGIEHVPFSRYATGPEIERFDAAGLRFRVVRAG